MKNFLALTAICFMWVSSANSARSPDSVSRSSRQSASARVDAPYVPMSICAPCDPSMANSEFNRCGRLDERATGMQSDGQPAAFSQSHSRNF